MEKRPLPHAYYRAKKYHLNINRILNFHQYGIGITWHALPEITIVIPALRHLPLKISEFNVCNAYLC